MYIYINTPFYWLLIPAFKYTAHEMEMTIELFPINHTIYKKNQGLRFRVRKIKLRRSSFCLKKANRVVINFMSDI